MLPSQNCFVTAVTTPVTATLRPDHYLLQDHCRFLLQNGCDGIGLFGTTGEGTEFATEDRMATLEHLLTGGIDPASVIVSVVAASIPDTARLACHALDHGVHGILLMPPCVYRSGITEEGTFRFFATAIEEIARPDMRLYLYHFPDICGAPITPQVLRRLEERYFGIIAGVKDSGGDLGFTETLLRRFSHLSIFTGSEIHLPDALAAGARGTICGMGNVMPRLMRQMFDIPTAFDRRLLIPPILSAETILSRASFIACVKAVLAEATGESSWRRVLPPQVELPMIERQRMVSDFFVWDAGLPTGMNSFSTENRSAERKVFVIRRGLGRPGRCTTAVPSAKH